MGAVGSWPSQGRGITRAEVPARVSGVGVWRPTRLFFFIALLALGPFSSLSAQNPEQTLGDSTSQGQGEGLAGRGYLRIPARPFSTPGRDLLNRGVWQGYTNLGRDPYETFTVSTKAYEVYDRMGQRLLRGYPLTVWEESRTGAEGVPRSTIYRSEQFWQWFDNLFVFTESHSGRNVGLAVGQKIRTALTPLTLQSPRWAGTRLDVDAGRHGVSLLATRGQSTRFSQFSSAEETSPIVQYGGRWHSRLGQVMTAGLTFFNQHIADVLSSRGNLIEGTLGDGTEVPSAIWVRVSDDSPDDATAARVEQLHIALRVVDADGVATILTSDPSPSPGRTYDVRLTPLASGGRLAGAGRQVQGPDEAVDYEFAIPPLRAADRAWFEAVVSGDYRISVRQRHQFFNTDPRLSQPQWEERQWPAAPFVSRHNIGGRPQYPVDFKPADAEPYYTVVRAKGNADAGEARRVTFDYGIPVGQTLLGADLEIKSEQLLGRGELVYNWQQSQFPFSSDSLGVEGRRHRNDALAGYLSMVGKLGRRARDAEVGLEIFRLDPDYSGGYESRRGGMTFFTDRGGDYETIQGKRKYYGFTQEFELVTDNDDRDDWSDDWPEDEGRYQPLQPQVYSGVQAHSGVFPGLDIDGDNTPDTDRNRNGVADWTEPFLMFDAEPPDFAYGIDFNNNGIPDYRENDGEADYPYRRDSKGHHLYVAVPNPIPLAARLTLGYYSIRQSASGGRSRGPYARLFHQSQPWRGLHLEFEDDVKYVRDTIRDDVYVFDMTGTALNSGSVLSPPPLDPLEMRKSLVNTAYLRGHSRPWRGLELEAQVLHLANKQFEATRGETLVQDGDVVTRLSLIGKAAYSMRWAGVDLWLGVKGLAREGNRDSLEDPELSQRLLAPMTRLSYPFMNNVEVQLGLSGFAFLPVRYTDGVVDENSYKQRTAILAVTHHTDDYLGYSMTASLGVQWQSTDYDRRDRIYDKNTFGIFAETFAGL